VVLGSEIANIWYNIFVVLVDFDNGVSVQIWYQKAEQDQIPVGSSRPGNSLI
jgi:hypothetical protein